MRICWIIKQLSCSILRNIPWFSQLGLRPRRLSIRWYSARFRRIIEGWWSCVIDWRTQTRPQGPLLDQNGSRRNPWPRPLKLTPRIVEYFVTWHTMKWLFRRLFPAYGGPVCFLQLETVVQTERRHFVVFTWRNSKEFWSHFGSPRPGVSPTAILNGEKALGTRTVPSFVTAHTFCATRDIRVS